MRACEFRVFLLLATPTTRIFTKWTHSCNHSQKQEIEYPPASQRTPWVPIMTLPPRVKNILASNTRGWFYSFRIYIKSIMPYIFLCIWLLALNLHSPLLILFHCLLPLVKRKHIFKILELKKKKKILSLLGSHKPWIFLLVRFLLKTFPKLVTSHLQTQMPILLSL